MPRSCSRDPPVRRRRRHVYRRRRVRRGDRRVAARQDADHAAATVTGIEIGVGKAGSEFSAARLFLHGTTVAINTILERSGAKCALLTTQGFRDIYEIGRVNRPDAYNLFFEKHVPLIDRDLRFEIMERMDSQGDVLIPLDEDRC